MTDEDNTIDVEVTDETHDAIPPAQTEWKGKRILHRGAERDCEHCHPDLADDTEMTSGIAIVTQEQYIDRSAERRAAKLEALERAKQRAKHAELVMVADEAQVEAVKRSDRTPTRIPDRRPVVRVDVHAMDQIDYDEDYGILRVLFNKIFRHAIIADVQLPDAPDIELQVIESVGELDVVFNDLDDARDGKDEVSWQLIEWKSALAA